MAGNWDAMAAAAEGVLADMERTQPGCVRLGRPGEDPMEPEWVWGDSGMPDAWLWDTETGSGTGLRFDTVAQAPWELVADATSLIQEVAFEVFWRAWPRCPEHVGSHPLGPVVHDSEVWWACPTTHSRVALVGELPPS